MKQKKEGTSLKILNGIIKNDPYAAKVSSCKITAQDSVPIFAVHEKENLIETYPGFFTRQYYITENNYQTETMELQDSMLKKWRSFINSIGTNCEFAITIHNKNINMADFRESVLKKEMGDSLDYLRSELNGITIDRIQEGKNGIEKKKYMTVGLHTKDLSKAFASFNRLDREISQGMRKIQSDARVTPIGERLSILFDMYNPGKQGQLLSKRRRSFGADENRSLSIDFENIRGMGIGIKDLIAPSSMQFFPKYMRLGRKYVRVMRISELPNMLSDEFFVRLTDVSFNMVTTINIRPMQNKEASALVTKNLTLAQSAKRDSLKALAGENLSEEFVPLGIREQVDRAMDLRSDMINEDEKLFKTTYTLMFYADSMEELSQYTEEIISNCQGDVVGCEIMYDYQEEGFNTTMPLLDVEIPYHRRRTLKSTSVATMALPFSNLELNDKDGINYSQNLHTRSLILYNRLLTQNYNGFILGTPGSGKSLQAKVEMLNVLLGSNSDLIVIDPEAEYLALSKLVGGETIKIEPGGRWHINPMEINSSYQWTNEDDTEETNPILAKADFILKLMEVIVKSPFGMNSVQETIIDECVHKLYEPFIDSRGRLMKIPPEDMPTLTDLQIALAERPEMEAKELAIALKLYTGKGSLNTFGFRSNVNLHDRFIVYNIKDIGDKLKPIAMLIILDSILNRLMENRRKGKNTWFWVDEIYLLFADERSAAFLNMLYKRARKYGGVPTGLTQNVEDLLESDTARKMLSNCNFVMMLNQAPNDREKLADLLNLSASQIDVITSAPAGQGLIFTGSNCVPFASTFPKYQKDGVTPNPIYKVLTSNMKEITEFEKADKRKQILERRQERGA
ncbi:hypothetical protein SAMN04487770_1237 [Butyrivibrio sp. ob235]|uniref:VirB4-like conjugal transfer ATPase, CD1110 family n=1 Tax=Butyrivibrio sp. ob235 TaxID=1761780 RepID=UPI0008B222E6|nr:DUF87 domain-containing protein [Butyrivibrio sp. ob235]SEL99922.1 hypothetical protein SAMN04487770_1237 [Butyrivibrio sp. ob235]